MNSEAHMATSGSMDGLWRSLLSSPSQLVISRVLKTNLGTILVHFDNAGLVNLSQEEILEVTQAPEELNKICHMIFAKRYGSCGNNHGEPIRTMCRSIQRPEFSAKLGLSTRQISALRRRAEDLVCACSALVHCRNVNAHEHYPIDDPGFALMLAGAITRVIEVAEIPADYQRAVGRIRQQCEDVLQACISMSASNDNDLEEQPEPEIPAGQVDQIASMLTSISSRLDEIEPAPADIDSQNTVAKRHQAPKTITVNDLGAKFITGQIRRQNTSLISKVTSEIRLLPTLADIELIVKGAVDTAVTGVQIDASLEDQLKNVLTSFESKIEEIRKSVDVASHRTDEERSAIQDSLDLQISELREIAAKSQEVRPSEEVSDGYFLEDDVPYETTSAPPAITPQQARNQLYQLRNKIRDEQEQAGTPIDNWENVLQGPIIERMIGDRISNISDWKKESMISDKYKKNKKIMKQQLAKYKSAMFEVIAQIET